MRDDLGGEQDRERLKRLQFRRMTNAGCDYLDTARDPKLWNQTKSVLENVGGSTALEVVKEIAAKFMAELIRPFIGGYKLGSSHFYALSASWLSEAEDRSQYAV
jgi:Hypothetical protein (DUF2513)